MKLKLSEDGRLYVVYKGRRKYIPSNMTKKQFKKYISVLKKKKKKKAKRPRMSQQQYVKQIVNVLNSKEPNVVHSSSSREGDLDTLIGNMVNRLQNLQPPALPAGRAAADRARDPENARLPALPNPPAPRPNEGAQPARPPFRPPFRPPPMPPARAAPQPARDDNVRPLFDDIDIPPLAVAPAVFQPGRDLQLDAAIARQREQDAVQIGQAVNANTQQFLSSLGLASSSPSRLRPPTPIDRSLLEDDFRMPEISSSSSSSVTPVSKDWKSVTDIIRLFNSKQDMEKTLLPILDQHNATVPRPRNQRIARGRTMQDLASAIMKVPLYDIKLNQEYASRQSQEGYSSAAANETLHRRQQT